MFYNLRKGFNSMCILTGVKYLLLPKSQNQSRMNEVCYSYLVLMCIAVLHDVTCTICNTLHCGKVKKSQLFFTCVKGQSTDNTSRLWVCNGRPETKRKQHMDKKKKVGGLQLHKSSFNYFTCFRGSQEGHVYHQSKQQEKEIPCHASLIPKSC